MRFARFHILKLVLAVALIGALAGSGLAHRISGFELDVDAQIYLLEGGLIEDLCADGEAPVHGASGCEFCRLSGAINTCQPSALMPPVRLVASTIPRFVGVHFAPFASLEWTRPARAPPVKG